MPSSVRFELEPNVEATILRRGGDVDGDMLRRAERVAGQARRNAPASSGNLRDSIVVRQSRSGGGQFQSGWDVVAEAPYAIYVHEGRRAGSRMPPSAPIAAWMRREGIDPSAEFPIRRAIAQRRIEGRPFLRDALTEAI